MKSAFEVKFKRQLEELTAEELKTILLYVSFPYLFQHEFKNEKNKKIVRVICELALLKLEGIVLEAIICH